MMTPDDVGAAERAIILDLIELLALQLIDRGAVGREELVWAVEDLASSCRQTAALNALRGRLTKMSNSLNSSRPTPIGVSNSA